jgi:hypothetical protein
MTTETPSEKKLTQWWKTISHHPLWAALIAALLAAFIIARSGSLFTVAPSPAHTNSPSPNRFSPVRISFTPTSPENFGVAFNRDTGIPHATERWAGLHARGGVDIAKSEFRITLANRSSRPLTVTNIEAEVRRSRPPPTDTGAYVLTQGSEVLEQFGMELQSAAVGRTYPLRQAKGSHGEYSSDLPLFFSNHSIALAPGAVYEAKVAVISGISRELEYAFVISGNTATGDFSYIAKPFFRIAGLAVHYKHEYWLLPERTGRSCWVRAYTPPQGLPLCPDERYRSDEL